MSSLPCDSRQIRPVGVGDLDALMAIEAAAYPFPWSRGNFFDSIAAGYWLQALQLPASGSAISSPCRRSTNCIC